jgi:hypothetical protein
MQGSRVESKITIVRGLDFREIITSADKSNVDLVLLGIHRHEHPLLFRGTTAERVIRFGHRPVLVVKDVVAGAYRRAIVAADPTFRRSIGQFDVNLKLPWRPKCVL